MSRDGRSGRCGTLDPIGRISLHEDKNTDGVYETHHVFVDKLVFPRFVMPFGGNAILAKESNADEVWKYSDTNNDLVAEDDAAGHGTHVAGTVGAVTDNGKGVAATCPGCKLLVAKAGNSRILLDSDIVQGIYWSVNNRARAINLSLGSKGKSRVLEHAVDYAWDHGVVVVAAAGNENTARPRYPAAYKHVISVSATNQQNKRAPFSNYGSTVDVAAPGVEILSTVPGGRYGGKSGTSMASPHVAALAGLLATQRRSAREIRTQIERTAKDIGPRGRDQFYGRGLIDANRAVRR